MTARYELALRHRRILENMLKPTRLVMVAVRPLERSRRTLAMVAAVDELPACGACYTIELISEA